MYEDSWYSFVPEGHGRQDEGLPQKSQHQRRQSLLQQPSDSDHIAVSNNGNLVSLYEEPSSVKSPPTATLARRAKSYSNFYEVVHARLAKESGSPKDREQGACHPMIPINTGLNFENLYEAYEDELLDVSHEGFQIYRDQLALSRRHLDGLLQDVSSSLDLLAGLSGSFKSVETQTIAFQAQCEDVLAEQKHIKQLTDDVSTGLQYYAYLEPITRRLNAPGASVVIGDDGFVEMLENLDACIEYMIKHPEHRESDIYLTRYKSILARTLNIMTNMWANNLRDSLAETKRAAARAQQAGGGRLTITNIYLLLAPETKASGQKFDRSINHIVGQANIAVNTSYENSDGKGLHGLAAARGYFAIYAEGLRTLINDYIGIRNELVPHFVEALITKTIADDTDPQTNFPKFARDALSSTLEICVNETIIFQTTFEREIRKFLDQRHVVRLSILNGAFRTFLSTISSQVYEIIKPHLQTAEISTAIDIATWMNSFAYYRSEFGDLVSSHSSEEEDEEADELSKQAKARIAGEINKMIISTIFGRIRGILFKDVERYNPKAEDLLLNTEAISSKESNEEFELLPDGSVAARLEKALGPGIRGAYPPVKVATHLLVHVNDVTFEHNGEQEASEVAYEILHQTSTAITNAIGQIILKHSKIDGRIFAIKNLILLKNLVLAYEIAGSRRNSVLDFTDMWATFAELRTRGGLFDITAYYKLLTSGNLLPKVVESVQDARVELDGLLRENITTFREESAALVKKEQSGGKKGVMTAEEQIKKKLMVAYPLEVRLRDSLWEAVQSLVDEKKLETTRR